ncbi:thiopurine S-methyltransferase [Alishewanella sp. HL-SH05]|uniref:thiopurine S-methyltransferase n=1 Tax=Alishewanella sp. HL-SH05 TaxID=3461145 RepID=UPI0040414A29
MDAAFWQACWQQNKLGFQLAQPHPLLQRWLPQILAEQPRLTEIVVPLCGKSPDLLFCQALRPVLGIELSDIACHAFFAENQLAHTVTTAHPLAAKGFIRFQAEALQLLQGDFFQLPDSRVNANNLIYDRAALIALPLEMRQRYVEKLDNWLEQGAVLLLISLEYPEDEKAGPPFSVTSAEIEQHFAKRQVQLLEQVDITGQGFARRRFETSRLCEKVYLVQA